MTFNPTRLILARKRRTFSKTALAKESKLSLRLLGYYEAGSVEPSDEAIDSLAQVLRFPVDFFFAPDLNEIACDSASFRSLTTKTASQRDSALAAGSLATALDEWIAHRFDLPEPSVPETPDLDPETAAQVLRAEWLLGEKPINNMVHIAEAHGIKVFSLPPDSAAIDAFSVWHNDKPYIFLNPSKSGERGRMDVAHEIGHLMMHRQGVPRNRQAELEANKFGSAFLMPAGDILSHCPRGLSLDIIHKMKARWKVSAMALVYRLHTLNLLSEWLYRKFCKDLSIAGFRRQEKGGIARETSQILGKVFDALRQDGVSRASVARDLGITSDELNKLISGLTISAVSSNVILLPSKSNDSKPLMPPLRLVGGSGF
jgi:Zn-dependent peptidase ImmA (M78 family)/transcriptional regulator with XRE-family HTH domain